MSVVPKQLKDLDTKELYRSAIADFALVVDEQDKGSKDVLLAAFEEGGVDWDQYVAMHPELAPDEPDPKKAPANVIKNPGAADPSTLSVEGSVPLEPETRFVEEKVAPVPEPVIHVQQAPTAGPGDKFLIKMERPNAVYETRGYRFTKENPYHLVDAADAQFILSKEDGFRQALPSELEEIFDIKV